MYLSTRQNTRELGISHRHIIHNDLLLNRLNKRRPHEMTEARTISSCRYMYWAAVFWKVRHFWYYSMRTANFWLTRCRSYLDRLRSALKLFLSRSLYFRVFLWTTVYKHCSEAPRVRYTHAPACQSLAYSAMYCADVIKSHDVVRQMRIISGLEFDDVD